MFALHIHHQKRTTSTRESGRYAEIITAESSKPVLTMINDLDSSRSLQEDLIPAEKSEGEGQPTAACESWKLLLCASMLFFLGSFALSPPSHIPSVGQTSSAGVFTTSLMSKWHINPFKKHHHGSVAYMSEVIDGGVVYKRVFTAPCGDGMLVFNVGPAAAYEPFAYDLYEDAYAYSNNRGLCLLYPSYQGIQTSDTIMWEPIDPTELQVDLGDLPNKISSRVVRPVNTKNVTKRGGDFLIIRSGNFYNPSYYKHLKGAINSWPADADIEARMQELIGDLE